jgi:hypothetical protein
VDVDTVVLIAHTKCCLLPNTLRFGSGMPLIMAISFLAAANSSRQSQSHQLGDRRASTLHQLTYKFCSCVVDLKPKFRSFKNTNNHIFPEYTSLRMAL